MSKIDKFFLRLRSKPKDFTWDEAIRILKYLGYKEVKTGRTGGSRRRFADKNNNVISLHEPHPGKVLKSYQIDLILQKIDS